LKKETKTKLLGALGLLCGAVLLSGCTANFCSNLDKANMAYPYEQGVTVYCAENEVPEDYKALSWKPLEAEGNTSVYAYIPVNTTGNFTAKKANYLANTVISSANSSLYNIPSQEYFKEMDQKLLKTAVDTAIADGYQVTDPADSTKKITLTYANLTATYLNPFSTPDCVGNESDVKANYESVLRNYGYLKFYGDDGNLWTTWDSWTEDLKISLGTSYCPDADFTTLYKNDVNGKISAQRSCIATQANKYGHYGDSLNWEVNIEAKSWGYAWDTRHGGFFEGLIVYPVSWLVDTFSYGMDPALSGWGQIWAIVFVTFIVRAVVLALTFKSTMDQQKTQALQPELAKLQAKYPNSNQNKAEAARLSQEQMALYKRNKVNPASMFLAMIVQFPIFICVWGALQGSAVLSSGQVLNLRLSDTIQTVLMNTSGTWVQNTTGWWTALVLFLLMSIFQWLAMMLPQWMTKKKTKKIAKTSANPAQDKQTNTMKWVSYGMLIFTIIMGFALPAAMGVYWAIGALISMIQTVITQAVMSKKQAKEKRL
jgi:YidC/Oxa1 family membrane protein insertase